MFLLLPILPYARSCCLPADLPCGKLPCGKLPCGRRYALPCGSLPADPTDPYHTAGLIIQNLPYAADLPCGSLYGACCPACGSERQRVLPCPASCPASCPVAACGRADALLQRTAACGSERQADTCPALPYGVCPACGSLWQPVACPATCPVAANGRRYALPYALPVATCPADPTDPPALWQPVPHHTASCGQALCPALLQRTAACGSL